MLTKGTRDTLLNNFAEAPPEAEGNGVAVSRLRAGASHAARGSPSADSAQLAWIESTLAASDADWKIVFGHFPVHSATTGEHGDTSYLLEVRSSPMTRNETSDDDDGGASNAVECAARRVRVGRLECLWTPPSALRVRAPAGGQLVVLIAASLSSSFWRVASDSVHHRPAPS